VQADRHPPLQMNFALYILHAEWQISRQKDKKFLRVFQEIIYISSKKILNFGF
jgi:hypothetical protein